MKRTPIHTLKMVFADTNAFEIAIGLAAAKACLDIIGSLVTSILIPLFSCLFYSKNLSSLSTYIDLFSWKKNCFWNYGSLISHLIDFIIISVSVYWVARVFLKIKTSLKGTVLCHECHMHIPEKAHKCPHCRSNCNRRS